jgi:threonine/homoserine/homoserine lactone efflux protein
MILPVDPTRYLAFMGTMAILAATPGPSNLYAVANGMSRGRKAVLVGVVGMNTATLVWYAAAVLGLSALALAFPRAVKALILVGAAYLLWLAYKSVKSGFAPAAAESGLGPVRIKPRASAFWGGFMVQITNPKILLFFGAVLPPFLDFRRPLPPQLVMFQLGRLHRAGGLSDGAAVHAPSSSRYSRWSRRRWPPPRTCRRARGRCAWAGARGYRRPDAVRRCLRPTCCAASPEYGLRSL